MDFQGIVWGSALAALFSASVFAILPIKFTGHFKLSGVIPFAILLFIGNTFANPLVQEGCDLQKGYIIALIAVLLYLIACVALDIVKQYCEFLFRRREEREELKKQVQTILDLLKKES